MNFQHELLLSRRYSITPVFKQLAINVAEDAEIDIFLYGQNFSEKLKAAKEIEKVGKDVARQDNFDKRNNSGNTKTFYRSQYRSKNLNFKSPLRRKVTNNRFPRGQKETYNRNSSRNTFRKK